MFHFRLFLSSIPLTFCLQHATGSTGIVMKVLFLERSCQTLGAKLMKCEDHPYLKTQLLWQLLNVALQVAEEKLSSAMGVTWIPQHSARSLLPAVCSAIEHRVTCLSACNEWKRSTQLQHYSTGREKEDISWVVLKHKFKQVCCINKTKEGEK